MNRLLFVITVLFLSPLAVFAAEPEPKRVQWKVDGVTREALVSVPATAASETPLVFAFHGHGGTMQSAARKFRYHTLWPDAVVVYMQGLPSPGKNDPDGTRAGWQKDAGDQKDRDLKFFDAVLVSLKKDHKIDEKRIYAAGHSNGGGFTYLLWSARPKLFAALAPSAGGFRSRGTDREPIPLLHVAGENDTNVPFERQKQTMTAVRAINGCKADGKEWAKGCTIYESETGAPFVSFIHPGTHTFPDEAPALIVKFFKEQAKK